MQLSIKIGDQITSSQDLMTNLLRTNSLYNRFAEPVSHRKRN